jgi:hypothetical protein
MKKSIFIIIVFAFTLKACAQQTFDKVVTFNAGFRFSPSGTIYLSIPGAGVLDWNNILNKPNFDLLYKPISYKPDWSEIQNKPQEQTLSDAIEGLGYLPIPSRSTLEINAISMTAGKKGLVYDNVLNAYKLYDGSTWSVIVITSK